MTSVLPAAVWIPGPLPSVYAGTPVEMVASMAEEMEAEMSVREAIAYLLVALAENRGLVIGLPMDAPEDVLARLFITSLLDVGLARSMAPD